MKVLILVAIVQSLNLLVFAWFHRVAGLRSLVLQQQLAVYKRKVKKPLLKNRDRLFWALLSRIWRDWASDAWLWQEMGIRGIPIPYAAPNAAAHMERLIGTLRQECPDRMLIWNERQLRCVLAEFINWHIRD